VGTWSQRCCEPFVWLWIKTPSKFLSFYSFELHLCTALSGFFSNKPTLAALGPFLFVIKIFCFSLNMPFGGQKYPVNLSFGVFQPKRPHFWLACVRFPNSMTKLFFHAAPKGTFFLQKLVQRPKKPTKVGLICRKRPQGPPCAISKIWAFWLKNCSGGKTNIAKHLLPPMVQLSFCPTLGFVGNSKMVLGVLPPNSIICPTSGTVSYGFIGFIGNNWICIIDMDNWIASWIVPITGSKIFFYFFHHFHLFLFPFQRNFSKLKSVAGKSRTFISKN
jgi:hypothetical protein